MLTKREMFEFFKNQVMENNNYTFVEQLTDEDILEINTKVEEYELMMESHDQ